MALKLLTVFSLLVLVSASTAFVLPNLQPTPTSPSKTHLAASELAAASVSASSEGAAALGTCASLLLGAALGLVISLGSVQSASAFERWPELRSQDKYYDEWVKYGLRGTTPELYKPVKDFPEECNLWTAQNQKETLKLFQDSSRAGPVPKLPASVEKCAKAKQAANAALIPPKDKKYNTPTTATGYGALQGIDRLGFGRPFVGKKIRPWSGIDGKIDPKFVKELGAEGPLGPYADPKKPGLGRENPQVRAWAEANGLANINPDGTPLATPVGTYKGTFSTQQFGNSKLLLDMPFYKGKTN